MERGGVTLEEALSQAGAQLQAGDLAAAESAYRAILERAPGHVDALSQLAAIEQRLGRRHRAVKLLEKAAKLRPDDAVVQLDLGKLRDGFGDHPAALRHYAKAIELDPGFAEAYAQLAWSFFARQRFTDSEAIARRALTIKPSLSEARFTLARALAAQGRLGEAVPMLGEVVAAEPGLALAHLHLASSQEDPVAAAASYRRALELDPGLTAIHRRLGETLRRIGDDRAAIEPLRRAVERVPGDIEAWAELGGALVGSDRAEAARCLERALALDPRHLGALVRRIELLQWDGRFDEAEARLEHLVAAMPERIERELIWQRLAELLYFDVHRPLPPELVQQVERRLDALILGRVQSFGALPARERGAHTTLRVGYLSENFGDQPIGHVTASLFGAHDRANVEVHGFSLRDRSAEAAPFAARIRAGFDVFHAVHELSPRGAASAIRDADIDILVDIDGHAGRRTAEILAYRPAPRQVVFLGTGSGLNLSCADYLISDRIVVPPGEEGLHREQIVRLPDSMHCADRHEIAARPPARTRCGLPAKGFVFGAFARPDKLDRAIMTAWLRILGAVEGSVLWLSPPAAGTALEHNLRALAEAQGVDPDRLVFAERLADKAVHLARHAHCGLLLDTPGFNAASTALDALWAGVPVLALKGTRPFNRLSASFLAALGMDELVCGSLAEYERRAIALARDPAALAALRTTLADQRVSQPLFDIARFAGVLELAYGRIWQDHATGAPLRGFDLANAPPPSAPAKPPKRKTKRKPA
jgi:predicted O-linked N-acetylglucosamine transferase (SPINDLY family)